MVIKKLLKRLLSTARFLFITPIAGLKLRCELSRLLQRFNWKSSELNLYKTKQENFKLDDGGTCKLINSAIKHNYEIVFKGEIIKFDTLIIGKGKEGYLSSYLVITRDSVILNNSTNVKTSTSYKHNLKLEGNLTVNINRKLDSTIITLVNQQETLSITADFAGMGHPFIESVGSIINVNSFDFNCDDYYSDVFIFGDSYVNIAAPTRWPFYINNKGYKFLCDGLPGGSSVHSYDFVCSAFSAHKPKYLVWCLGMNDGSDGKLGASCEWKLYVEKVMDLCAKNNVTLILATIPSVYQIDNTKKTHFVKKSGYRFIDFDKAVSDGKGNWKEGMLSSDGIHPTAEGAEALAEEFLKSFPEIKQNH